MMLLNTLNRSHRAIGAGLLACASLPAHAGRPMTVDDAAIVSPGQCQLESYVQRAGEVREFWATPACNVGGDWELALGGAVVEEGATHTHLGRLQAKTVFKPLEADGWGAGLVLANQFSSGRGLDGDLSVNVPLSFSLRGDSVLLHLNAGAIRSQTRRVTDPSWGIGAEFKLDERNSLTAESFGQRRSHGRLQLGFAHALIPDRVQIDATLGKRLVSIGLVLQTP
ncbi:hypothetical protein KW842_04705 [Duganella sp. sic0402]|uniref:hypothetical protein n=1 Tax=Duganella sp. sic0402 TaxID=2854786 RepID=UPI001C4506EA|nr:hypothetical protein [Duganella sp. sic0402]MBV7535067.1 hypothetical protein [Duganella sp. sic0402]